MNGEKWPIAYLEGENVSGKSKVQYELDFCLSLLVLELEANWSALR